ncbi:helix-turn-helix domain-containing protein, partial [Xanthomonas oryzae]|uniref:helix-turn-helix domain-containing protein n=1 Tax=Xanthomonas oryzae TaxID=347 RepID=UPI000960F8FF
MPVSAVQPSMKKRDGGLVSRAALEEMRLMALQRMGEGESPAEVAASFGLHRGWAYKVLARAQEGGAGALMTRKGGGGCRPFPPAPHLQAFGCVTGI